MVVSHMVSDKFDEKDIPYTDIKEISRTVLKFECNKWFSVPPASKQTLYHSNII